MYAKKNHPNKITIYIFAEKKDSIRFRPSQYYEHSIIVCDTVCQWQHLVHQNHIKYSLVFLFTYIFLAVLFPFKKIL